MASDTSPLAYLSSADQSYYEKVFDYSMETIKTDEKYVWATNDANGIIVIGEPYISKSGKTCRNFNETYTIQQQHGSNGGIGCKRVGEDGWCQLKATNAPTCAIGNDAIAGQYQGGFNVNAPNFNPNINTSFNTPDRPNINTNVNTNINTGNSPDTKSIGKDVASSVTGNAGKAAGNVAGSSIKWFTSVFR